MRASKPFSIILLIAVVLIMACSKQDKDFTYTTSNPGARELFLRGLAADDQMRIDDARNLFDEAIAADSEFAIAYYYRALTATSAADFREHLEKALKYINHVTRPESLLIMSLKATGDDDPATAEIYLEEMVDLLPESARAHFLLGSFYLGQQEWKAAEQELFAAISRDENFAPAYNKLAYAYSEQGKFPDAIEALQKYAELQPDDPNPHDSMGEIYLRMGDYDSSIKEYEAALEIDPMFNSSHIGIGHDLVFTGQYDNARKQYDYLLTQGKSIADTNAAYYWDALSYIYENDYKKAIETLQEQYKFAGDHNDIAIQARISGQIARIYIDQGDYGKALSEAEKQRELASNNALLPATRQSQLRACDFAEALIYTYQNKKEQAQARINAFRESAENAGNAVTLADWHGLLGITAFINKNYERAVNELEQSDSLNMYQKYFSGLAYEKTSQENQARQVFTDIAGWNDNSLDYALVRNKAMAKL